MAFYLRKSVKLGPVRFNLSKSGIGASVGVKGFRVGVRPNGKSYLYAGRYGLYYRQELNGGAGTHQNNEYIPQRDTEIINSYHHDVIEYNSATSQELASSSRKELISNLNQSYTGIRLDYICAVFFILSSIITLKHNNAASLAIITIGILSTFLVAVWESKRRTVTIEYEFENDNSEFFKKIISAFNNLSSSKYVWALLDSRNIHGYHESKLNSGASSLVKRSNVYVGEGKPPWVNTNIDVPVLKINSQTLYMLPDGIIVYDEKGVGFVEYDDVSTYENTTKFIEERPPIDAKIVGYTWKYPNKDGGPDRRFKNNYKIPICLYGELKIKSTSGLFFYLMTSKHDSPLGFKKNFSPSKLKNEHSKSLSARGSLACTRCGTHDSDIFKTVLGMMGHYCKECFDILESERRQGGNNTVSRGSLACTRCGTHDSDIFKTVLGMRGHYCKECFDILESERRQGGNGTVSRGSLACTRCGTHDSDIFKTVLGMTGHYCKECFDILESERHERIMNV